MYIIERLICQGLARNTLKLKTRKHIVKKIFPDHE